MNLKRLLFGLGLASLLAGQTLHAQQGQADRKLLDELLAKAGKGDAKAQCELAGAFLLGRDGVVRDEVEAVKWFRNAASKIT